MQKIENRHIAEIKKIKSLKILTYVSLSLAVISLIAVIMFILVRGIGHLNKQLLFGDYKLYPSIKPAFIGTIYLILISILISAPIGIGSAIFLVEYTNNKSKFVRGIRIATETLAGIPSIVYGLFGYIFFVVILQMGYTILGGGLTIAIMILPLIVRTTEESLLAVPNSFREGSYALGVSKVKTIFSVVLPSASSGIVTSIILAIGRVISESAVLILTIGMVVNKLPKSFLVPGTSLALDVYYFGSFGYPEQAAATGVVLLLLVVSLNVLASALGKVLKKGTGENV